jgi:hypothetical protein
MRQNQLITNLNTRFSRYFDMPGFYTLDLARGDTDGPGSFPAYTYDGQPSDVNLGRDLNGDTIFIDRPAFARDLSAPGVLLTEWGAFKYEPGPGSAIIPPQFTDAAPTSSAPT